MASINATADEWDGRWTLGLGGGGTLGVSEAPEQAFNLLGRIYGIYHINNYVGIELGAQTTMVSSKEFNAATWGDYSTSILQPDLKLRLYPVRGGIQPYLTGGMGMMLYTVDSVANSADPAATLDGSVLSAVLGAGIVFMIGDNFGIDVQGTTNLSLSDDQINPTTDGNNDAYWGLMFGLSYTFGTSSADRDGDGLTNDDEKVRGTNPDNPDTDGDGLQDGSEVNSHSSDPLKVDTDGDGLNDGAEVNEHSTNPTKADTDGDGLDDGMEVNTTMTDATKADTDGDGLQDGAEVNTHKTDPKKADSDGEGLTDGSEVNNHKTNPLAADSDNDGLNDREEIETYQTAPMNRDTDNDGLSDGEEVMKYKTQPKVADTDRGSILDGVEVKRGTNPLNADDDIDRRPKLEVGKAIVLEGIVFETGKSTIKAESEPILNGVLQTLSENPEVFVMITGHTDNVGKRNSNMKLSQARADAVRAWLVAKGIESKRMSTMGYGPDRPIVPNDTDENKQKNRRIEFERVK